MDVFSRTESLSFVSFFKYYFFLFCFQANGRRPHATGLAVDGAGLGDRAPVAFGGVSFGLYLLVVHASKRHPSHPLPTPHLYCERGNHPTPTTAPCSVRPSPRQPSPTASISGVFGIWARSNCRTGRCRYTLIFTIVSVVRLRFLHRDRLRTRRAHDNDSISRVDWRARFLMFFFSWRPTICG